MIGSKAMSVAQSSEDNLCSPALASNSLGRKSCTQSSGNLVGQLIQRNVPGAMASSAGLSAATTPHHLTHHHPPMSGAANQATPPHHLDHHAIQTRSIATSTPGRKVVQHSPPKKLNNLFGVSPSDIDKYSRVVFPVCFVSVAVLQIFKLFFMFHV